MPSSLQVVVTKDIKSHDTGCFPMLVLLLLLLHMRSSVHATMKGMSVQRLSRSLRSIVSAYLKVAQLAAVGSVTQGSTGLLVALAVSPPAGIPPMTVNKLVVASMKRRSARQGRIFDESGLHGFGGVLQLSNGYFR